MSAVILLPDSKFFLDVLSDWMKSGLFQREPRHILSLFVLLDPSSCFKARQAEIAPLKKASVCEPGNHSVSCDEGSKDSAELQRQSQAAPRPVSHTGCVSVPPSLYI